MNARLVSATLLAVVLVNAAAWVFYDLGAASARGVAFLINRLKRG